MMIYLQRLGKSLMLPVACLPVAGILIGIGYWIESALGVNVAATFLQRAGGAVIENIPILFAVGIAVGMSEDRGGVSALAGLVSWIVLASLLSTQSVTLLTGREADPAFAKTENVFMAIIAGLIGAWSYNRFKDTHLPEALAFFSGKRSVAIMAAALSCLVSLPLLFIWPWLYNALIDFGSWIMHFGAAGAGIYVFLNRLLIPLGLHHALNQVFWFDVAGINDLGSFWSGQGILGETGQYMTGFFPIMMFGLPAAALAMYRTARPGRRKTVGGLLLAAALSSFLTGVTEPLEFSFMFLAPGLYLAHALLSGLTAYVTALLPVRAGFNFSAGLVDYLLCLKAPMALNPHWLLLIGLVVAAVYYLVFRLMIVWFDLPTPGREKGPGRSGDRTSASARHLFRRPGSLPETATPPDMPQRELARRLVDALGGKDNIRRLDNCISRLRIELADDSLVDDAAVKAGGVSGLIRPGKGSIQIVIGTRVQFVADEMRELITEK
ncbi:MAG: PTS transporter subunit EIIC [Bacteroidales bacterium]|nr:PTS transporter subunit EIIC [Bacteroidales bacterium]